MADGGENTPGETLQQRVRREINEALKDSTMAVHAIVEGPTIAPSADEKAMAALRVLKAIMPICIELAGELEDVRERLARLERGE